MPVILSRLPGGPESLELAEIGIPAPDPDEVLIEVHAVALNYPDALIVADRYQVRRQRLFVPAMELAGRVVAVVAGVTHPEIGERVMATGRGALAEFAVTGADSCFAIPPDMPCYDAAALHVTYGTAPHALADRGRSRPGERLFVFGASGSVGLAAVQIGIAMGAYVVAAASPQGMADLAAQSGASQTLVYPRLPLDLPAQKTLGRAIAEICAPGTDVAFDQVGDVYANLSLRALAWGGRYLAVGFRGHPCAGSQSSPSEICRRFGRLLGGRGSSGPPALCQKRPGDCWIGGTTGIKPVISRVVD
ncbi:alcohol dehydrogenase catalytic domain-containing protein [Chachezhania sediminis]|uniref:alcohol dehydrogenase catalytic domain-containing protein n=1 Tax=Chachezhania sediminis TaxID=2599291 RepID=UPI00131BCF0F|nr:zinc-binding dehydrogenase [Chachezhania sediminis]